MEPVLALSAAGPWQLMVRPGNDFNRGARKLGPHPGLGALLNALLDEGRAREPDDYGPSSSRPSAPGSTSEADFECAADAIQIRAAQTSGSRAMHHRHASTAAQRQGVGDGSRSIR